MPECRLIKEIASRVRDIEQPVAVPVDHPHFTRNLVHAWTSFDSRKPPVSYRIDQAFTPIAHKDQYEVRV
jgi:hypothetical protein